MKQTAVEWFYQRILAKDIKEVFEQAKQMEKEQIELSHLNGQSEWDIKALEEINKKLAKEYYKETYGQ